MRSSRWDTRGQEGGLLRGAEWGSLPVQPAPNAASVHLLSACLSVSVLLFPSLVTLV